MVIIVVNTISEDIVLSIQVTCVRRMVQQSLERSVLFFMLITIAVAECYTTVMVAIVVTSRCRNDDLPQPIEPGDAMIS